VSLDVAGGAEPLSRWIHYLYCTVDRHPRLLACRRFDEVLLLDIPASRLEWIAFDVTALHQQLGLSQRAPHAYIARPIPFLLHLRKLCERVIEAQWHTFGSDGTILLRALRVVGLDHAERVVEVSMDPRTDDLDRFLLDLVDPDTGTLQDRTLT